MTAATATLQTMRDRLVQAIDGQSNQIRNMVAVMEVISYLERNPITKEALEETRLGKLINDVRRKTKNEDLAKRAKKLVLAWQKLIEPGQQSDGGLSAGLAPTSGSSNGAGPKADVSPPPPPPPAPPSGRPAPELKNRNDFNNSLKADKPSNRKRRAEQSKDGTPLPPAKVAKMASNKPQNAQPPPPPSNGTAVGADVSTDGSDSRERPPPTAKEAAPHPDADGLGKTPVRDPPRPRPAHHPTSLGCSRTPPSASSLLKASLLQQHARLEQASSGGQCQPRSPRSSSHSPRTPRHDSGGGGVKQTAVKTTTVVAAAGGVGVPLYVETPGPGPSLPPPPPQPLNAQGPLANELRATGEALGVQGVWVSHTPGSQPVLGSSPALRAPGGLEVGGSGVGGPGRKKRKKYRSKDYVVNLDGQSAPGDGAKPVRLKDRRLTFDPVTGQIRSCLSKEPGQEAERGGGEEEDEKDGRKKRRKNRGGTGSEAICPEAPPPPQAPPPPVQPSPFQQTNWKELSSNDIIQSYLSQQSSVLTTLGAPRAPGAHFFMNEYLKQQERQGEAGGPAREARRAHVVAAEEPVTERPGECRDVTADDLRRLHGEHWPGVNGCYDTKKHWYDWTECMALDPHGDESRLNILPYVCLD
ncbi:mediator of RNA polymerase II transcription subunit 26-like isoform X1 [Gadus chalcogrammus]|uniref:mediator of RNA polymerase II transcription subunit 26-like isoform X1 n=1 Tax=Gadus chalcogrammus TaxID=1042646 RepID=UPI0024C48130|nr:mediator of RNA polymerase II transcription subunit 26-like isoform X1 [Gadus chalcogrammus]